MNKKKLLISAAIALPLMGGIFAGVNVPTVYAGNDCNAEVDLQGTVSQNHAKVTNYSQHDCSYDATLAVYDSPKGEDTYGWIDAQTLIGSKTVNVKAGETVEITVDGKGSSCLNQSDLIRGKDVWTPPYYRNAMDVDVYKVSGSCESVPTPTMTPGPTPTPTAGASASTNSSSSSSSTSSFAPTGNTLIVYALVITGAISLIFGMILKKLSK